MSMKISYSYRPACVVAVTMLCMSLGINLAQAAPDAGTTTVKSDSDNAKALKLNEPSYQTREERLKAKPLDWRTTTGKPVKRTLTAAEKETLRKAKRGSAEGGNPDPRADEEARKLHPDEWAKSPTTNR